MTGGVEGGHLPRGLQIAETELSPPPCVTRNIVVVSPDSVESFVLCILFFRNRTVRDRLTRPAYAGSASVILRSRQLRNYLSCAAHNMLFIREVIQGLLKVVCMLLIFLSLLLIVCRTYICRFEHQSKERHAAHSLETERGFPFSVSCVCRG